MPSGRVEGMHNQITVEVDEAKSWTRTVSMDYPSSPWTGFYNYGGSTRKHRMNLVLLFANRTVSGHGNDDISRFFVSGGFDQTNGECYWSRSYIGAHDTRPLARLHRVIHA
jgi:hypothetical protein